MRAQALRPEEELRRAQHEHILATIEEVAQDDMHEMVDEQRRRLAHTAAHEIEISSLNRLVADEPVAKTCH